MKSVICVRCFYHLNVALLFVLTVFTRFVLIPSGDLGYFGDTHIADALLTGVLHC